MKLTKLSLTNFRSFKQTQTIDFAPTTLLFGPNSAGKSTVLMALFYVQHILEKGSCDPQYISALGDKFIGGFKNLVHGRDINKPIKLKIEFEKDSIGSTYFDPSEIVSSRENLNSICAQIPEVMYDTKTIALEFTIEWSKVNQKAYVSTYQIWLNDEFVACLRSDSGMNTTLLSEVNFEHHLLQPDDPESEKLDSLLASLPISIESFSGALPSLGRQIKVDVELEYLIDRILLNSLISEIIVSPLDNLFELLSNSVCIGPLRMIPNSQFEASSEPLQSDWYNGKAAWDRFYNVGSVLIHDYNYWLNDKLNLGYQLVVDVESISNRYAVPNRQLFEKGATPAQAIAYTAVCKDIAGEALSMTFSTEDIVKNPQAKQVDIGLNFGIDQDFLGQPDAKLSMNFKGEDLRIPVPEGCYYQGAKYTERSVKLWDVRNNIPVAASDIGVGISQIFPLIVAGLTQERGVVSCEQPELHVHPRIQVELGDFLTQSNDKVNYLIETHSEHIILRILRRIRETTDNELPDDIKPVYTKDVSIMYIESGEDGVVAKRIEIDDDGEFVTRWPKGFFGERREELF